MTDTPFHVDLFFCSCVCPCMQLSNASFCLCVAGVRPRVAGQDKRNEKTQRANQEGPIMAANPNRPSTISCIISAHLCNPLDIEPPSQRINLFQKRNRTTNSMQTALAFFISQTHRTTRFYCNKGTF